MAERGDGGKVTSLAVPALPYDPYRLTVNYPAGASGGIVRGDGADWFGPLNPQAPSAPDDVQGRGFDFPSGYNLNIEPRAYEPIKFADLRALADSYDLLRIIVETRKDQMAQMSWNIKLRDSYQDEPQFAGAEFSAELKAIEAFFRKPDQVHYWDTWLRELLEEMFVLDAPALYRRRTKAGKLYALEVIDGATIKRVIDDWGRTPAAPVPAYQQVLHGLPAVNYTTDDLIYAPRNVRAHKVYGYSPVEQIIMTVNIALRRQIYHLQYFTEGNVPEALIGVPETWTPTQIREFQVWWDNILEGNTAARRHAKFVPGGVGKTFIATREAELTNQFDEWLARICCFCFSVSPQPFVAMMNRATAETAQQSALQEGLVPIQSWVKQLIDGVIQDDFGCPHLEFRWKDDREVDSTAQASILQGYVKAGILSVNEARDQLGLDPTAGGDKPMFATGTGFVPLVAAPQSNA